MLTGGCFCGAVRYEAVGKPFNATLCHCTTCRRTAGAPVVAWFSVRPSEFRLIAGTFQTVRSSERGRRSFCPHCGTQITFKNLDLDEVDITTASLDDPKAVPPNDQVWTASRIEWFDQPRLPAHRHGRSDAE